jgi:hypothetical protein
MDRRENLKVLLASTVGTGFILGTGCKSEEAKNQEPSPIPFSYGRTEEEKEIDKKLLEEVFFTEKEKKMVAILSDIIIPADDVSGSATDAGVPDFIEFMMKDIPKLQLPMRGGLMWLENLSMATFDKSFVEISPEQRISLIEKIAWPDTAGDDMQHGVKFFNLMRNLTCTGFFTTQIGVKDIGYEGNRPNQWDGVPASELEKYGLSYDANTLKTCLKIEDQNKIAQWDDKGNLIG